MTDWSDTPVLEGSHIRLEPLGPEHADGLLQAADPEVFAHLTRPLPTTIDQARAFISAFTGDDFAAWAQIDRVTGRFAGMTTYYDLSPQTRSLAIGWTWLGREFWRTPVNTEAKFLLLDRAFATLDYVRVVWHVDLRNERSQRAVGRIGGLREGVLRKHKQRRDGSWRDTVLFAMTDEDWPGARKRLLERLR